MGDIGEPVRRVVFVPVLDPANEPPPVPAESPASEPAPAGFRS